MRVNVQANLPLSSAKSLLLPQNKETTPPFFSQPCTLSQILIMCQKKGALK